MVETGFVAGGVAIAAGFMPEVFHDNGDGEFDGAGTELVSGEGFEEI